MNIVAEMIAREDLAIAERWAQTLDQGWLHRSDAWRKAAISDMLPLVREMRERCADAAVNAQSPAWGVLRQIAAALHLGEDAPTGRILEAVQAWAAPVDVEETVNAAIDVLLTKIDPRGDVFRWGRPTREIRDVLRPLVERTARIQRALEASEKQRGALADRVRILERAAKGAAPLTEAEQVRMQLDDDAIAARDAAVDRGETPPDMRRVERCGRALPGAAKERFPGIVCTLDKGHEGVHCPSHTGPLCPEQDMRAWDPVGGRPTAPDVLAAAAVQEHAGEPGATCAPCSAALERPSPCAMTHDPGPGVYPAVPADMPPDSEEPRPRIAPRDVRTAAVRKYDTRIRETGSSDKPAAAEDEPPTCVSGT